MAELSNQQKKALRKLQASKPLCVAGLGKAESFLLNYISFEAQARRVLHYYRCRDKIRAESKAGIPIAELKKAMDHFAIPFDEVKLNALLDSKLDKRNGKSARNLRNGMVHQWLEADCKEVEKRFDEFFPYFREFDAAIRRVL
ncbi:MAG: hypothetical protein M0P11_05460 [Anaerolineaceae bacterium]|nr:hypothetical protein [Anaerolineaceae bacterium]